MALPSPDAVMSSSPTDIPVSQVISDELSAVRKNRAGLMTDRGNSRIHIGIILALYWYQPDVFFYRTDYHGPFYRCQFYVNMYYFIIVLVLQNVQKSSDHGKTDLSLFRTGLKEIGLKLGYNPVYEVVYQHHFFEQQDAVSRDLPDICHRYPLYDVGILLHGFPLRPAIIVISQCAIIIVFYLLWYGK